MPQPVLERADAPTLALSSVHLDVALLRQLLVFERTVRSLAPLGCAPEQLAQAHATAVAASGLASSDVEAPLALLRRFAANRARAARLAAALAQMETRAAEDPVAAERARELRQRLVALDEAVDSREDAATRRVLEGHAAEILALFAGFPQGA